MTGDLAFGLAGLVQPLLEAALGNAQSLPGLACTGLSASGEPVSNGNGEVQQSPREAALDTLRAFGRQATFILTNLCRGCDLPPEHQGPILEGLGKALIAILRRPHRVQQGQGQANGQGCQGIMAQQRPLTGIEAEAENLDAYMRLNDACNGLHLLTRSSSPHMVQMAMDLGTLPALSALILSSPILSSSSSSSSNVGGNGAAQQLQAGASNAREGEEAARAALTSAIKVLGNMAAGVDEHTMAVLQEAAGNGQGGKTSSGWLRKIPKMLRNDSKLSREVCFLVANLGATPQGAAVLAEKPHGPALLSTLVETLESNTWDAKREALFALSNFMQTLSPSGVRQLVDYSVLGPLVDLLQVNDIECISASLMGLSAVLALAAKDSESAYLRRLVDEAGGVEHLLALQVLSCLPACRPVLSHRGTPTSLFILIFMSISGTSEH